MVKPKICVTITASSNLEIFETIQKVLNYSPDLIELRLDYMHEEPDLKSIRESTSKPIIATFRRIDQGGVKKCTEVNRVQHLLDACEAGVNYLDLEFNTPNITDIIEKVHKLGIEVIVSYHNFKITPKKEKLQGIIEDIIEKGADICKIIGTAIYPRDNITYFKLIDENPKIRLVSFAMGKTGMMSRIFSPIHGAEYTYASAYKGKESASGQLTIFELNQIYRYIGVIN